jgi:MFS family permease
MRARLPSVFYGWWLVGASALIALYVGGGVFYGFTAIFEPIADELGWSYAQISLAASLRGLEMGLLAPVVGVLTDRLGPRRLIFGGAIMGAIGLLLLSRATSLPTFYGAFVLIALAVSTCTMTVLTTAVSNWFRRKIGIASGIAVSGFGLGGLMVPVIVRLVESYDWRVAVAMLAAGMLVVPLPLSLLFRHRPEHYGYLPDGQAREEALPPATVDLLATAAEEASPGLKRALASGVFAALALSFTCHTLLVTAVITHVMPYLSSVGISRSLSGMVATAVPLASIAGRLGFGWFGDRHGRKLTTVAGFGMMSAGLLSFGYAGSNSLWLLLPFLILFGTGYGGVNVMRVSLVQEHFGRRGFGTIFGVMTGVNMIGSLSGPALAGWAFDTFGSYRGIWLVMSGAPLVAVAAIMTLPPARVSAALRAR